MTMARLSAVLVCQLLIRITTGQTSGQEGPWVRPCAGNDEITDRTIHRPRHSHHLRSELLLLKLKSETAASLCGELSNRIVRIILPSNANALNNYPSLMRFPETQTSHVAEGNVKHLLLWDVERLAQVGVFLEQILLEYVDYIDEIRQLEIKYRETKCQVHRLLGMMDQEVTSHVSRDIMPDYLRNISEYIHRNNRNYLIIRDMHSVFDSIANRIGQFMVQHFP